MPIRMTLLVVMIALAGCAGGRPDSEPALAAGGTYARTFDAAKATLRDQGFILERVDAAEGVITTRPKDTAGIATPWHSEQQSVAQEFEDLAQRHQRVVRVTFERADGGEGASTGAPLQASSPCRMSIHVTVLRLNAPGRRLEPETIRQTSAYADPDLVARGMQPQYAVAWKQDERLAAHLTAEIGRRAGDGSEAR